jgi:hypothetical protein
MRAVAALAVLATLAGCGPRLTAAERHGPACQGYGFQPGTVEMAQCIQQSVQASQANAWAYYNATRPQTVYVQRRPIGTPIQGVQPLPVW